MLQFPNRNRLANSAIIFTCTLAVSLCAVFADTVTLKDGKKFEGKLISESATEVKIEVGTSVKEVRTFKRSDVASVEAVTPDQIAFKSIEELLPTPDLLDQNAYRHLINGLPKRFITSYPNSPLKGKVEKVIATLEAEKKKAAAGDVKVNGQWISASEIEADRYNHEAMVSLYKINKEIEADSILASLREFDRLESRYVESISYPQAVAKIRATLPDYAKSLDTQLEKTIAGNIERKKQIESMRFEERDAADAAYAREINPFLKRHEEEKKSGQKWLDYHSWDEGSVKYAQKETADEIKRLERIDVEDLVKKASILKLVALELSQENFATAKEKFAAYGAVKSGTRADKIKVQIAEGLKGRATVAKNEEVVKEIKREDAATSPVEKTTEPEPTPEVKPVAETKPKKSSSDDSDDPFDDSEEEADEEESGGISLLTILLLLIPVMGIVTFLSIRSAKKNQIEDFVPEETDE